jgi:hypothetical protein
LPHGLPFLGRPQIELSLSMNRRTATLLVIGCLLFPTGQSVRAQKQNKKRKRKAADPAARLKKKLAAAELPTDVLAKANKVVDDHAAELKAAQAELDAVLTPEQKQARREAQKKAKEAGQKRKQAKAAAEAAMKLTTEQKTRLAAAEKNLAAAHAKVQEGLRQVLTPEQLAKAGFKTRKRKNK